MSFVCSSFYFLLPCCRWSQNLPMNLSFPPLPSSFPLSPSSPLLPSPRPSHWVSISNLHSSHTGPLTVSQEHPVLSLLWDVIYVLLLAYIVVTICPSLPGSVLVYSCCLDINITKLLFHTHTCSSSDDAFYIYDHLTSKLVFLFPLSLLLPTPHSVNFANSPVLSCHVTCRKHQLSRAFLSHSPPTITNLIYSLPTLNSYIDQHGNYLYLRIVICIFFILSSIALHKCKALFSVWIRLLSSVNNKKDSDNHLINRKMYYVM